MERSSSFALSQPVSRLTTPAPLLSSGTNSVYGVEAGAGPSPRKSRSSAGRDVHHVNEPGPLYELCPDGSVVRLRCPVCGADRFRSLLGLVNHCRINCGLLVSNPEERIQRCGLPVGPEEAPPAEYFAGRNVRRERDLAAIRAGVQGPIVDTGRRPQVREFSETDTSVSAAVVHFDDGRAGVTVLGSISSGGDGVGVDALQSRFHVRKRIVVGNFARSLESPAAGPGLEESEAAARQIATHEWRLFVRPHDPHDDMGGYVRAVRFHLHPSYAPNDVITVERRPFDLAMTGWGEFPARVELLLRDGTSVQFVHFLRLRPCPSRTAQQLMSEQAHDLELLRRPVKAARLDPGVLPSSSAPSGSGLPVEDALATASRLFPLFGAAPKQQQSGAPPTATYNRAVSYGEFLKLPAFDQQVLERERALALQRHLLPGHPGLSLDFVLDWCRRTGLTPLGLPCSSNSRLTEDIDDSGGVDGGSSAPSPAPPSISTADLVALLYCRYCGLAHFPQERFELLQKNCAMRPRKLHLSSRSTAADLVAARPPLEPKQQVGSIASIDAATPLVTTAGPTEDDVELDGEWTEEGRWVQSAVQSLELLVSPERILGREACQSLARATRAFLADLMARAATHLPDSIERAVGRPALLTPLHCYQAITGMTPVPANAKPEPKDKAPKEETEESSQAPREPSRFDFLSNAFMAGT